MSRLEARMALNFERLKKLEARRADVQAEIEADGKLLAKERGLAFMRFETLKQEFGQP